MIAVAASPNHHQKNPIPDRRISKRRPKYFPNRLLSGLALLLSIAGNAPGQISPRAPLETLTPSGPIVADADGQVIQNLLITATDPKGIAVNFAGHKNVTLKNCYIRHANFGVLAQGSTRPIVDHCVFVNISAPAKGKNPSSNGNAVTYDACNGAMEVTNCEFFDSSTGVYLNKSPGARIQNINGYNMRGPFPRGQLVQFASGSDNGILEDFYNFNDLDVSWPEDNVNVYLSKNVTIRRGCVDGNNSPSGIGVIFDGSGPLIEGGLCEDVDALHQGNGAFSAFNSRNIVFNRVRTRDGHNVSKANRGKPSSNGLTFHSWNGSTGTRLTGSYHKVANPNNLVWDGSTCTTLSISDEDFVPRGPVKLTGMPYTNASEPAKTDRKP